MKRFAEDRLHSWFVAKGRKPLVIRGARQVGKSTLVRNFASQNNLILHEINLEKKLLLDSIFKRLDIPEITRELELVSEKGNLAAANTLLFLDEIQAVPSAIPALRYFFEERPGLPVVAAGSLLEFALSKARFPMPVGRIEYLYLGPMGFREFLGACREDTLLEYLEGFHLEDQPSVTAHDKLLTRLREYLLTGGMPEAVKAFSETGRLEEAFRVHHSILETVRDDFSKYADRDDLIRLHKVLDYLPSVVGEKFRFSRIDPSEKSATMRGAAELLERAGLFHRVVHSSCSGLPLQAGSDPAIFKPLFLDVGLMNGMRGIVDLSREKFMDRRFLNEGKMAEQFVGQHLLFHSGLETRPLLHYWLREERANGAEVDFVISAGESIVPVEVKAGLSGSMKSLLQFVHEKKSPFALRFDLNQPSIHQASHTIKNGEQGTLVRFMLLSLPLYMVESAPRLLKEAKDQLGS